MNESQAICWRFWYMLTHSPWRPSPGMPRNINSCILQNQAVYFSQVSKLPFYCLVWLIFHTECFRQGLLQWYRNTQKAQEECLILTALSFCIQTLTLFSRLSDFKEQCWVFLTCQKLYCRLHSLVSQCYWWCPWKEVLTRILKLFHIWQLIFG